MDKQNFRHVFFFAGFIGGEHEIDAGGRSVSVEVGAVPSEFTAIGVALPNQIAGGIGDFAEGVVHQSANGDGAAIVLAHRIGEYGHVTVILASRRRSATVRDESIGSCEEDLPVLAVDGDVGNAVA